jgi:hypothetical protein
MVLYLCVFIVFSLHRESLKLILEDRPLPEGVLSQTAPLPWIKTVLERMAHRHYPASSLEPTQPKPAELPVQCLLTTVNLI